MNKLEPTNQELGAFMIAVGTVLMQQNIPLDDIKLDDHKDRLIQVLMQNGIDGVRAEQLCTEAADENFTG